MRVVTYGISTHVPVYSLRLVEWKGCTATCFVYTAWPSPFGWDVGKDYGML
jgi:hypothetical protein